MESIYLPARAEASFYPGLDHPAFHLLEYFICNGQYYLSLKGGDTLTFKPSSSEFATFQDWLDKHKIHRVQLSRFLHSDETYLRTH